MGAALAAGPAADTEVCETASALGYGGFALGPLHLALPMEALREVVPCTALTPLPCPARGVVGALALRGVLLPVLDLRLLMGQASATPCAIVVVMVHEGRVLGLLADAVNGIFLAAEGGRHRLQAVAGGPVSGLAKNQAMDPALPDALSAVLAASVLRADTGQLVSVLCPSALARLPQVPMLADPEPRRQQQAVGDTAQDSAVPALPMMLLRCGRVGLAIDAMAVHAALSDLTLERSVLGSGAALGSCLGVIDYAAAKVPVLDLSVLCGLGPRDDGPPTQAFVLKLDDGMVALLVDEVLDVAATQAGDVLAVPAYALPRAGLFAGALPATALADVVSAAARTLAPQYLVLAPAQLRQLPEVASLSRTNTPGRSSAQLAAPGFSVASAGLDGRARRAMITYALGQETATPIEQVAEILPYQPEAAVFKPGSRLLGMVVNRGRSIPVICLSGLSGQPAPLPSHDVSVLVVEHGGEWVGFAVPRLLAIEPADWEPELPSAAAHRHDALARAMHSRRMARVGQTNGQDGAGQRMVRVLDLQQVLAALQAEHAPA